jgi:hypothetical protein
MKEARSVVRSMYPATYAIVAWSKYFRNLDRSRGLFRVNRSSTPTGMYPLPAETLAQGMTTVT